MIREFARHPLAPLMLPAAVVVWCTARIDQGLSMSVIDRRVMELWVHGPQPEWFGWVPWIHPPLYSTFMNGGDAIATLLGAGPETLVLWSGALCAIASGFVLAAAMLPSRGAALLAGTMAMCSTETVRPFEHYPLARLAVAVAFLALTRTPLRPVRAAVAVSFTALLHLFGGLALLAPLLAGSRSLAGRRVLLGVALLVAASLPFGLSDTLASGPGSGPGPLRAISLGGFPVALLVTAFLSASLRRERGRPFVRIAGVSTLAYAAIVSLLQLAGMADGAPFPFAMHYYELIEPVAILAACGALTTLPKRLAWAGGLVLLGVQLAAWVRALVLAFSSARWAALLLPFSS